MSRTVLRATSRRLARRCSTVRVIVAVFLLWNLPSTLFAGPVDPRLHFRQVRTPHFTIYFHQDEERLASHLVAIVEDVRARVGSSLGTTLPAQTHVIIADQAEFANGYATPLPRNTIFLNATAPSGAEFIGHADDWLRVLFTHEYTHIVHLDRSRGWATLARGIFGRAPFAFPNLTLPQWQIEGLATWQESASTGSGRATAGDFRAVETITAAARRPLTLDLASGGLVSWPDGHAAYAAGLGFHEYLAGRFGAESLGRLANATAGRLPYLGTPAFTRVYGQSLGSLWTAYSAEVARRAESLNRTDARPVVQFRSGVVSGPRFAPLTCGSCPQTIVYSVEHADAFPSLREVSDDGTGDRELSTRYLGSTAGVTPTLVVFDQLDLHRVAGLYADLYALDRRSGRVTRLTTEGRMQDPDIAPDGHHIVVTWQRGDRRELLILDLAAPEGGRTLADVENVTAFVGDALTSFSAPRWSPDGRRIAVERRRASALPEVVIFDVASRRIVSVLASPGTRIVTPTWRPDGEAIVAAADFAGQPFDLYEFALNASATVRRLTKTGGALWPDVRRDGRVLTYAGSTAAGSAVFVVPYEPLAPEATDAPPMLPSDVELPAATSLTALANVNDRPYSPLPTLLPTSWSPVLYDDADGTRVGGAAYGSDVLGRHAYGVEATWLVERPAVERTAPKTADWSASYAYTRWQPTLFVSASKSTSAVVVTSDAHSATTVAMVERQAQVGASLPVPHVLHRTQWLASMLRTERQYLFGAGDRRVRLASARLAFAYGTAKQFGYSISPERGVSVGTTLEIAARAIGSEANATTATIDARAYAPGPAAHHVIALRAAGGISNGAALARQSFRLGADAASPSVLDFGAEALGLLRGLNTATLAGRQIVVGNAEYRFPLLRVERGHGTWPLFVRFAHAAIFADAGRVRGIAGTSANWQRAEGAEFAIDGVAGYALPFTLSVGSAWTHDGSAGHGPAAYVRMGRSF